ncbi:hypothetical protein XI00_05570 [Bradyrhizobium sp. CCBAU 21359]|nr:hypothetical protein [Bradyrhizobium sp. CCBAU 21359]
MSDETIAKSRRRIMSIQDQARDVVSTAGISSSARALTGRSASAIWPQAALPDLSGDADELIARPLGRHLGHQLPEVSKADIRPSVGA